MERRAGDAQASHDDFARLRRVTTGVYDTLSQGTTYASSRYLDATQRSVGNDSSNTVAAYGIARRTAGDEKLALTPSVDAAATLSLIHI